jgi:Fic family protein
VITGAAGKEKVHYEAPASADVPKASVRSAIAHLYFETIHPFEDGNGRIGRANAYYAALEKAQRSNDITPWVSYFVKTVLTAQLEAEAEIEFTLKKTRFFDRFWDRLNEKQLNVIQRMLEEGATGFEGGMNARKYIGITKTSKATATRDIQQLLEMGAFLPGGKAGGRSTSYQVNFPYPSLNV